MTLVLCTANVFKALCGLMAASAAGPIDFFWAASNPANLPGLSAKAAAQSTLSNGLGLLAGFLLTSRIGSVPRPALVAAYAALTALHLAANASMLRCVALPYLNRVRAAVVLDEFDRTGRVLTPEEVARREPLLFGGGGGRGVQVGGSVRDGARVVEVESGYFRNEGRGRVNVLVEEGGGDENGCDARLLKGLFLGLRGERWGEEFAIFLRRLEEKGWDIAASNAHAGKGMRVVVKR
jgi:hypothetical protein